MAVTTQTIQRMVAAGSAVYASYSASVTGGSQNTWVELVASTSVPIYVAAFRSAYDGSGSSSTIKIATGAAGAEVEIWQSGNIGVNVNQYFTLTYPLRVAAGTRLSAYCTEPFTGAGFTYYPAVIYVKESSLL